MISNRQDRKLRKEGEILEEDKVYFREIAKNDRYVLYFLPSNLPIRFRTEQANENYKKARRRLLCKLGKNTAWCTAAPDGKHSDDYLNEDIYVVHENNKPLYQFSKRTFRNARNKPVKNSHQLLVEEFDFLNDLLDLNEFYDLDIERIVKRHQNRFTHLNYAH